MNKAINITSLIGIILQSFSSLLFLVFLILSITGAMDANFTTTVNGETTVHSAEAAQHVFNVGFFCYIHRCNFFTHFWNYWYDEEKN